MATPLVAVAWGGAANPRGAWSADDAASWTTVNLPTFANGSGGSWSGLAYSPKLGMFVAIASGGDNNNNAVARSTDNGHSWTGTAVPNPNTWTMNGICWAGVARAVRHRHLGRADHQHARPDIAGRHQLDRALAARDRHRAAIRSVGRPISASWSRSATTTRSLPRRTASIGAKRAAPATSKNWRFIVWAGGAIQKFCMIAGNASGNNDYAYCSDPTSAAWSQKSLTGSAYDWQAIAYSPGLDMLMVVGGNTGVIARSTDGVNYTQLASGLGGTRFDHACWSDAGMWLVIGANTLYTSPNGVTWTAGTPPSTLSWHRVAAANALPLAGNLRVDFSDGAALAVNSRVPIPPGAHFYWRVYVEANNADSYTSIGEVYMRAAPGGADLCVGGTALESGHSGSDVAANAFNRTEGNRWATVGSSGVWVGYRFPIRQAIVEFALKADTSYLTQVPKRFWLEWSDDGVAWRTAIGAINETGWSQPSNAHLHQAGAGCRRGRNLGGALPRRMMSSGAFGSADYVEIQELEFRDANGVDLTDAGGGTAIEVLAQFELRCGQRLRQ